MRYALFFATVTLAACVGDGPTSKPAVQIDDANLPGSSTSTASGAVSSSTSSSGAPSSSSSSSASSSSSSSSASSSSSSGSLPMITCYPDGDGDGYAGPGAVVMATGACPARTVDHADPADCDDVSTDVHPGQTRFYGSARPHGGFDYDCNGNEEKRFFDSAGRGRTDFLPCETATTEAQCVTRYAERLNGTMPAVCGQATDAALACMWSGGRCDVSAFEPIVVRCR